LAVVFASAPRIGSGVLAPDVARAENTDHSLYVDRIERRRQELALPDPVLDPSWNLEDPDPSMVPGGSGGLAPGEGGSVDTEDGGRDLRARIDALERQGEVDEGPSDDFDKDVWANDPERFDFPEEADQQSQRDPAEW
jgi:hypothetical protein